MIDLKWLETCATAGEFLYGEFPMDVLLKMYATKGGKVTAEEVLEHFDPSTMMAWDGERFSPVIAKEGETLKLFKTAEKSGNPYASLHFDRDELLSLRAEQSDLDEYWIPTAAEITELVEQGYIRTPAMTALEGEIRKRDNDPAFLIPVWSQISTDKLDIYEGINVIMTGIFPAAAGHKEGDDLPPDMLDKLPTMDDLNALMPHINEFMNSINRRSRKGWPPAKLFKKTYPHGLTQKPTLVPGSARMAKMMKEAEGDLKAMGANVDYSTIDSFSTIGDHGERKVVKVGRNDPCPCGSGKKYKKCHGRLASAPSPYKPQ